MPKGVRLTCLVINYLRDLFEKFLIGWEIKRKHCAISKHPPFAEKSDSLLNIPYLAEKPRAVI